MSAKTGKSAAARETRGAPEQVFPLMTSKFPVSAQYDMLLGKQYYPYENACAWDKFNDMELPPREAIFSTLTAATITPEGSEHAQNLWRAFEMNSFGDNHDL